MAEDEEKKKVKFDPNRRAAAYVEEAHNRIMKCADVISVIIVDKKNRPVKTTENMEYTLQFIGLFVSLVDAYKNRLRDMDPTDEMVMMRVRTLNHEVIILPDGKIMIMVVQNAKDTFRTKPPQSLNMPTYQLGDPRKLEAVGNESKVGKKMRSTLDSFGKGEESNEEDEEEKAQKN